MSPHDMARAMHSLSRSFVLTPSDTGWRASVSGVEIKKRSVLSSILGAGKTTDDAIFDAWRLCVVALPADEYLVIDAMTPRRRAVRWNGFMWENVTEEAAS